MKENSIDNIISFRESAKNLLNNRFADRYQSIDIVEQSILLDAILKGL